MTFSGRDLTSQVIFFLSTLAAIVTVGYALAWIAPVDPGHPPAEIANLFLIPQYLHPKPHDRFLFLAVTAAGTAIILAAAIAWRRLGLGEPDLRVPAIVALPGVAIVTLVCPIDPNLPTSQTEATVTAIALIAAALSWTLALLPADRARQICVGVFVVISAILAWHLRVWNSDQIFYSDFLTSHFEAATFSVIRVAAGGTCLADVVSQYGCYGEFLAPLLKVGGSSTAAVTAIFAALQFIAVASIMLFCGSIVRSPVILLAALACLLIDFNFLLLVGSTEPYLQYYPVRLLFPALSLWVARWMQDDLGSGRLLAAGIFGGLAMAWNLDSGIAVAPALLAFALMSQIQSVPMTRRPRELLRRGALTLAGIVIALAAFVIYLELKSGGAASIGRFIAYQENFYVAGFAMMPMPGLPAAWVAAVMTIVVALLFVAVKAASGTVVTRRDEIAAYLAVLAIGLFLYFSGRSHWTVLRMVIWPEIILFFYFIDLAMHAMKARRLGYAGMGLAALVLLLPLTVIIARGEAIAAALRWRAPAELTAQFAEDVAFINNGTQPSSLVLIYAVNQGSLYGNTGVRVAWSGPSVAEMLLKSEFDGVQALVANGSADEIFVGAHPLRRPDIVPLPNYDLVAVGPGGRLSHYRKRGTIARH